MTLERSPGKECLLPMSSIKYPTTSSKKQQNIGVLIIFQVGCSTQNITEHVPHERPAHYSLHSFGGCQQRQLLPGGVTLLRITKQQENAAFCLTHHLPTGREQNDWEHLSDSDTVLAQEASFRMWFFTVAQLISWPGAAEKRDLFSNFQAWIRELGWKKTVWTEREGTGSVSLQKDPWEHQAGSKIFPCSSSLTWDQFSYNAQPHSKFRELSNSKAVSHVHYSSPAQEWAMLL